MIPPAFLHDLLARVDIVDVIGRHVQLKKGGANLMGLCPFHGEKSPSFSVSPSKQFYHCFGCGASGDAIRFLTEHTGASFIEAVNDLAQQVGMTVPEEESTPAERERASAMKQKRATFSDVLAKAAEHYRRQLKSSPRAIDYLKRRGLSGEIAAQFGLGYAPEGWRALASAFPSYDDPLLEESGMVIVQEGDGGDEASRKRYDRFRDRIMFPIRSVQGEVIGFGGRVLDQGEPKYLNSPETPVFSKGRELYGLHEARTALRQRGYALVVEGYMDVVALAQAGFANAVATLGTACTPDHVQKLFRFTDSVVFSFDGDAAGRRAAGRALEASLPHASDTRTVRFLFLPPEHDPDSFVREHGAAAFEQCVAEAVPLSRQIAETAADGCKLDDAEGRARMLANARPLWSALPEGGLRLQVLGDLATRGRLESAELLALWGATPAPRGASAPPARKPATRRAGRLSLGTANLLDRALWLVLQRSDLWASLDGDSHDLLAGQPAPYDAFFACIDRTVMEHGPPTPAALMQELRAAAEQDGGDSIVLARIARFHDPEAQTDIAIELTRTLDGLRLQSVGEELQLIFESGVQSPDAQQRCKDLMETRARLKARL
ncbi:MAG: DNA primase [Methylibium sp. NZG]|nr:MAG: DNA primase [Methylibium sp. NZG]